MWQNMIFVLVNVSRFLRYDIDHAPCEGNVLELYVHNFESILKMVCGCFFVSVVPEVKIELLKKDNKFTSTAKRGKNHG